MELPVWNPQKGRYETLVDVVLTDKNTTWFVNLRSPKDVWWIADYKGGLLIQQQDYSYTIWIYDRYMDISRAYVEFSSKKAKQLLRQYYYF